MQFEDFFVADDAEKGVKVTLPDQFGEPTEHWFVIRHLHSDSYRKEIAAIQREVALSAGAADGKERDAIIEAMPDRMFFSLVAGWSFDKPLTLENLSLLLKNAPYLKDFLDKRTSDAHLFFQRKSKSSQSTQQDPPSSKKGRKTDAH